MARRRPSRLLRWAACCLVGWLGASLYALPPAVSLGKEDYARAEKVLDYNLRDVIKNARVAPHWIWNQNAFWYQRQTDQGTEYVVVDAAGRRTPLFDHRRLA